MNSQGIIVHSVEYKIQIISEIRRYLNLKYRFGCPQKVRAFFQFFACVLLAISYSCFSPMLLLGVLQAATANATKSITTTGPNALKPLAQSTSETDGSTQRGWPAVAAWNSPVAFPSVNKSSKIIESGARHENLDETPK